MLVVEETKDGSIVPRLHPDFEKTDAKRLWDHLLEVFVPQSTSHENLYER